jgi:hypothetical protein
MTKQHTFNFKVGDRIGFHFDDGYHEGVICEQGPAEDGEETQFSWFEKTNEHHRFDLNDPYDLKRVVDLKSNVF